MKPPVVVLVVLVLLLSGCQDSPALEAEPAPSSAPVAPAPPGLDSLQTGAPPRVGYVVGSTYVAPGGDRTRLPTRGDHRLGGVLAFDGGLVVDDGMYFEGTSGLSVVTRTRTEQLRPCTSGAAVDGDAIAWATFACPESGQVAPTLLHLRTPAGELVQRLVDPPDQNVLTSVVGIVDGDVVYSRAWGTGGTFRSDLVGVPRRVPAVAGVAAVDESHGLLAVFRDADGRRTAVLDRRGGVLWSARRWYPSDFSPDGTRLLGRGRTGWTVRDARTGEPLLVLDVPERTRLDDVVWESERHLVALARSRRDGALLRFGHTGQPERITPVACADCPDGYLLAGP